MDLTFFINKLKKIWGHSGNFRKGKLVRSTEVLGENWAVFFQSLSYMHMFIPVMFVNGF